MSAYIVSLMPGLGAAAMVGVATWFLCRWLANVSWGQSLAACLITAAAAASSSPSLAAWLRSRRTGRSVAARGALRMMEFSAGVDDIWVLGLSMAAFALFRTNDTEPVAPLGLLGLACCGGAALGGVTWLFLGGRMLDQEKLLLGLGMLALSAGFGSWLELSPVVVTAVSALVLVNLPGARAQRLLAAVEKVERPAVVMLMVMIGYHTAGALSLLTFLLVAVLVVLRLVAKVLFGELGRPLLRSELSLTAPKGWGFGLAPQGVLGLLISLSFFHVWRDEFARTVLAAVMLAAVVNEAIAPWCLLRSLRAVSPGAASLRRSAAWRSRATEATEGDH